MSIHFVGFHQYADVSLHFFIFKQYFILAKLVVEMLLQSPDFNTKTKPIHTPNVTCNTDSLLINEPLHSKRI